MGLAHEKINRRALIRGDSPSIASMTAPSAGRAARSAPAAGARQAFSPEIPAGGRVQTSSPQSRARRDGWRPAGRSPGSALCGRYRASAASGRNRRDYPLPSPRRNARQDRRDAGNRRSDRNRPRRSPASKPVIFMRESRMILRVSAMRSASGGRPSRDLSGLPGETITQMLCRPSRRKAMAQTSAWPACGGLNDPPNRPMRMPRAKGGRIMPGSVRRHARHI